MDKQAQEANQSQGYGLTHPDNPKSEPFLKAYAKLGNITDACKIADISRETHYDWMRKFEGYKLAFESAKEDFADKLESIAMDRINATDVKAKGGSDLLLITMLNAHKPEKYRQYSVIEHTESQETRTQLQKLRKEWEASRPQEPTANQEDATPAILRIADHRG